MSGAWRLIQEKDKAEVVFLGQSRSRVMAMGFWHGGCWRHLHTLEPVCFEPTHCQSIPDPPEDD